MHCFVSSVGGQGPDCGSKVVIWNMSPIRSARDEQNKDVPKVLCEMTNHLGCVNCVRWSVDGKWLASGGDDTIVMIWQIKYQGAAKASFGGTTYEQWGCVHILRGHNGDVLGVSWSLDQKYLASCSVDNSIIIWNAKNFPEKFSVISGHAGLVKGITWDPVGKYIASQSDDRTLRIWRTSDWKQEKQITEPFSRCGGTTHVLRLSWSPDGKFIVSAHALNNDGPTAQIIKRGDWETGMDFVGHRKAVEVVSFNPHLFVRNDGSDNHGCVAIGSRDRALSVWLTNHKRPLVVTHELFTDSILDLSWSTDGYELMVCSTDGSVAYLCFSKKELGVPLSKEALDELYVTTYGTKTLSSPTSGVNLSIDNILIEDPEMLKLHSEKILPSSTPMKMDKNEEEANVSITLVSENASQPSTLVTQQKEVRTKDGRRRITPMLLASEPSAVLGTPLPFTSFSPGQSKSGRATPTKSSQTFSPKVDSNEKKTEAHLKSPPPKPISFEPLSPKPPTKDLSSKLSTAEFAKSTGQKRQLDISPSETTQLPKAKKSKKVKTVSVSTSSKPSTPQKSSGLHAASKQLPQFLPIPEVSANITHQIPPGGDGSEPLSLEVDNSPQHSSTLVYRRGTTLVWSAVLSSEGVLLSGNHLITCVICKDKSLSVYSSQTGRLLIAKLYLPFPSHGLETSQHFVMVVSSNAQVCVWDTRSIKCTINQVPFGHFLEDRQKLLASYLTRNGLPVLTVGSASYVYHPDMQVWMEACHSRESSEITTKHYFTPSASLRVNTPLSQIQKAASNATESIASILSNAQSGNSSLTTPAYLESQISRSLCLQSPLEYEHWCKCYVRYLVKENLEGRLREFCLQFSGPSSGGGRAGGVVLGFQKQALLREFLAMVAQNAKLQRLYCELRDSLDI